MVPFTPELLTFGEGLMPSSPENEAYFKLGWDTKLSHELADLRSGMFAD
jgi:hypothetical protein